MGNRPFCPNEDIGAFGFSIDHKGYFVTRDNFYSYNPSADTWTKKQDIPSEYIYSADVVGKKAYVFADNKEIWTYDPTDDSWRKETVYPGIWYGKIVSLTIQDKIYYGVSYHKNPLSGDAAQDFWEYSVSSKTWYSIEKFPVRHSQRAIFAFSLGEHGFIGANNSKCVYDLWKFSKE
jgi:N-acetylneuraminic acid mutarotase